MAQPINVDQQLAFIDRPNGIRFENVYTRNRCNRCRNIDT